jgi:hypothetical protein
VDVAEVLSQVREVAVWVGTDGPVRDTARFLLQAGNRAWYSLAFNDPLASELTARMRTTLPGFDDDRLLDAVGSRRGHVEVIWPGDTGRGPWVRSPDGE